MARGRARWPVGETAAPLRWSRTENVRWRAALPEPGNSTPVVWGDSVFLTQPLRGALSLICFDRRTGAERWRASVPHPESEPTHETNPYGSASPATDGERVVVWFGSEGVHAYDLEGRRLWRRDLGRQRHTWGYGSSPVIHDGRVFLNFGPGERSFVVALDGKTGSELWRADVPGGAGVEMRPWKREDMYGSWSTPIVVRAAGRDELIVSEPRRLEAFEPASGKVLWRCGGLGDLVYPSPVAGKDGGEEPVVVAASGFGGPALAVRAGGSGDVSASRRAWLLPRNRMLIGSAVISAEWVYWVDLGGIAQCVRLSSGEPVWTGRLAAEGGDTGVWSLPVLIGDTVHVMNRSGCTVVFRASPRALEVIAVNRLEEPSNSSVVISGGDLFLRTHAALWCIGKGR